jgi:cation diffusion facilitator CzcD-associated flavoprotein CzcO
MTAAHPHVPARSPEQVLHERAAMEVSGVLLVLEDALDRARQARRRVAKDGYDRNAELALVAVIDTLTSARKRFERDTVYAGPQQRLI